MGPSHSSLTIYSIMFQCFTCVQLIDALANKVATCRCLQAPAQRDCVWANRCVTNPSHQSKVKPFFFRALSRKTASGVPQYQRKKVQRWRGLVGSLRKRRVHLTSPWWSQLPYVSFHQGGQPVALDWRDSLGHWASPQHCCLWTCSLKRTLISSNICFILGHVSIKWLCSKLSFTILSMLLSFQNVHQLDQLQRCPGQTTSWMHTAEWTSHAAFPKRHGRMMTSK